MLRLLVLLLVLVNASYYAWSQRLLAPYGYAPATQTEPERMAQQIKPESLLILSQQETPKLQSVTPPAQLAPSAGECLQAGLFNDEQTLVLRARLIGTLPPGSWAIDATATPARWLVYMGKYNSEESVTKKKAELRALGVTFDALNNASLEPGLSLGDFKTQPEAEAGLAIVTKKGVKTAKVMLERAEQRGQRLTLPAVDAAMREKLEAIKPVLAGKPLQRCVS